MGAIRKTRKPGTRLLWTGLASTLVSFGCPPLLASDSGVLEELIVTSQRKSQSLNDVPIAVQAFSEKTLEEVGVDSLMEISLLAPSVVISERVSAVAPYIRGVGSEVINVGNELPVGIYIDDVYQANPMATVFSLNSIERVETLKGPQGTLFGRNTTGGVIHVITKDPTAETRAQGSLSYGDYDTSIAKLYATTGIYDNIAADLAIYYRNQGEGYGYNHTLQRDVSHSDEKAIRSKWLISPTPETDIRIGLDYAENEVTIMSNALQENTIGADAQLIFAGCVADAGGNPAAPTATEFATCQPVGAAGATRPPANFHDSYSNRPQQANKESLGASVKVNHSFQGLDLVSISGYRLTEVLFDFEQAATALPLATILVEQQHETFTQELQLISEGERLDWIAGVYYMEDTSEYPAPNGLQVIVPAQGITQALAGIIDKKSYSVFGELTYRLTDDTSITGGVRWNKDDVGVFWGRRVVSGGMEISNANAKDEESWTEPTYRMILDHHFDENLMMFASYSRGYKSGSYNSSGMGTPAYNPEFIDAYEVGLKATLFDGSAQINSAAWYYDLTDLQVSRVVAGSAVTVNAAAAEISGIELDFQAMLTDRLQILGGFTYIDHEYTNFPNAAVALASTTGLGGNVITALDISGRGIPVVSDLTLSVGGNYEIPTDFGSVRIGLNYYYNDGKKLSTSGRNHQDSYALVNAYASWYHPSESWGLRAFGENLTDEEYITSFLEQSLGDIYTASRPRTWGLEVFFDF